MKGFRLERLQSELYKVLYSVFNGEISDNRISGISITKVKLSPDLSLLKVYFSDYNQQIPLEKILELLNRSSGFIKKQIAGANIMRTIPQIVFQYDETNERVGKMDELFRIIAEEKRNNNYYDDDRDNVYYDDDELEDEDFEDYEEYTDDLDEDLDFDYEEIEEDEDDNSKK
ncbi:MAG: 30S ribosome-binding factor RbfA [Candidatus Cloacimonetes bacterium]|nr:30S ribosome-binding factor RbfA [Candidatus Cloacimonadota bacterium]MDD4156457.1 30S ribosome-binding factor RbfA [Candidatus Cloacimonadota bacterium]